MNKTEKLEGEARRRSKAEKLEGEARQIEERLKPWKGLTMEQAITKGWGEEQERLQSRLWQIGYLIIYGTK